MASKYIIIQSKFSVSAERSAFSGSANFVYEIGRDIGSDIKTSIFRGRFNEKLQHPTVIARLCGRPTVVVRQLTTLRVQGAICRDCGRTTVWSVILHGFWLPTKRQATSSQATSSRGVRGRLRSLDSTSNNAR
ncbi:hypothetical protein DPMN_172904 [Dreissena polymorpha]|uniref:Uncharacterized protein n=1 Tax=Dreissena polymorpha TaxID=45954 RepID=A0A9D4E0L8_DREPO|nr:hypothetical protein DPMN_172904 [Dreissena polymorpha]